MTASTRTPRRRFGGSVRPAVLLRSPGLDVARYDAGLRDGQGEVQRELWAVVGLGLVDRKRQPLPDLAQAVATRELVAVIRAGLNSRHYSPTAM